MTNDLTIKSAILCEDVRREDNGKLIFLGIYEQDLQLAAFPVTLILRLVILGLANKQREYELRIKFELDSELLADGLINVISHANGSILLPLPSVPIALKQEGLLKASVKLDEESWIEVWSGAVKLSAVSQSGFS